MYTWIKQQWKWNKIKENEPAIEKNGASDDRLESGRYTCMKVAVCLKPGKVVGIPVQKWQYV